METPRSGHHRGIAKFQHRQLRIESGRPLQGRDLQQKKKTIMGFWMITVDFLSLSSNTHTHVYIYIYILYIYNQDVVYVWNIFLTFSTSSTHLVFRPLGPGGNSQKMARPWCTLKTREQTTMAKLVQGLMSWFPPTARTPKLGREFGRLFRLFRDDVIVTTNGDRGRWNRSQSDAGFSEDLYRWKKLNLMVYQDLPQWHVWNSTALDHCVSSPATSCLPQESIGWRTIKRQIWHTHVALSVSLMPIPIRHVGRGPVRIDWLLLALQNCWSRVFFQSVSLHTTLPSPSSRVRLKLLTLGLRHNQHLQLLPKVGDDYGRAGWISKGLAGAILIVTAKPQ